MNPWWMVYGAALLTIVVLDSIWLGFVARDLYRSEMGNLMAEQVRAVPAAVFYIGYPAGLVALALVPRPLQWDGLGQVALRGALVGLVAYGTYDLTCASVIRGFSIKLALIDMAWGTCISALAATAAGWVMLRRG